ncbi:resistin-like isoform X4 [Erpetoichthys calabaricus]|uniref:resistin-like isoform X4 n=1 Tax=Erpetoichthys calabaricus TaxID=27687 RepID=UPI00109EEA53|nr:resistin-like isoform X4 [Erpetoichthys calabaricus]
MKSATLLLLLLLLTTLWCPSSAVLAGLRMIKDLRKDLLLKTITSASMEKATKSCTSTNSSGSYANCQSGYLAVSCSCGNSASWEIKSEKTCHCANQDWTSARCCKIGKK